MDYANTTFERATIALDGCTWTNCVFRNCEIVFRGGLLQVQGCTFDSCMYNFLDAAARTMEFIHMLGSDPEGRTMLEPIFTGSAAQPRTLN